jgi:hypothetical protein
MLPEDSPPLAGLRHLQDAAAALLVAPPNVLASTSFRAAAPAIIDPSARIARSPRQHLPSTGIALLLVALWEACCALAASALSCLLVKAAVATEAHPGRAAYPCCSPSAWLAKMKREQGGSHASAFVGGVRAAPTDPSPNMGRSGRTPAQRAVRCKLPPRPPHAPRRLTVCLDLDETLLCCYRAAHVPAGLRARCHTAGAGVVTMLCPAPAAGQPPVPLVVFERPGCRLFLERLASFAEVGVREAGARAGPAPPRSRPGDWHASLWRLRCSLRPCGTPVGTPESARLRSFTVRH